MEQLFKYMNTLSPVSKASFQELEDTYEVINYRDRDYLCKIGEDSNSIFFIDYGIVRSYVLNHGEEINMNIFSQGDFFGSYKALIFRTPSKVAYQCLTDATIIKIDYYAYSKICFEFLDLKAYNFRILEDLYLKLENRVFNLLSLTPKERYLKLRNKIPKIDYLISTEHIASHLGISSKELTEIREEMVR